jgi:hypothetical protein
MRTQILDSLIIVLFFFTMGCRQPMSERTNFPYTTSVTAPKEYPVEVYLGYLSDGKTIYYCHIKCRHGKSGLVMDR